MLNKDIIWIIIYLFILNDTSCCNKQEMISVLFPLDQHGCYEFLVYTVFYKHIGYGIRKANKPIS